MTYRLLHDIADAQLPLQVDDSDQVDQLRAYVAAGLVVADIPAPVANRDGTWQQGAARVLAVTVAGQKELSRQKAHPQLMGKLRRRA